MRRIFVVTFDDTVRENEISLKILDRYDIKGTFFLDTGRIDSKYMRELTRNISQWNEIGSHTVSHPDLTRLPIDQIERELKVSKEYLENLTDKEVISFAYPFGRYNKNVVKMVRLYYRWARTTEPFSKSRDAYLAGVTLWAYPHAYRHSYKAWRFFGFPRSFKYMLYLKSWDKLASYILNDRKFKLIHLLVHSKFLDQRNEWKEFETVLEYVSSEGDLNTLTFSELMRLKI